jgi:hypothetical protein
VPFLPDASHELGTPTTVALGHVELIQQAATGQVVAEDARVVAGAGAAAQARPAAPAAGLGGQPGLPAAGTGRGRHGGP